MRFQVYVCPHTTIYVSSYYYCILVDALSGICVSSYVSSYHYIYVIILLYTGGCASRYKCPHTTTYMCPHTTIYMRPHTTTTIYTYMSSYYYIQAGWRSMTSSTHIILHITHAAIYLKSSYPIHLQCVLILVYIRSWRSRTRKPPILRSPRRRKKRRKKAGRAKASWRKRVYLSMGRR